MTVKSVETQHISKATILETFPHTPSPKNNVHFSISGAAQITVSMQH